MNRRDLIKGAVLGIPSAALVAATPENGVGKRDRVVMAMMARTPGVGSMGDIQSVEECIAKQTKEGRRVVQVIEGAQSATVVVEVDFDTPGDALEYVRSFNVSCFDPKAKGHDEKYGAVCSIAFLAAGQVLDVMLFAKKTEETTTATLQRSLNSLRERVKFLAQQVNHPGSHVVG